MKIALAMIVKGDDKEAELLKNCLTDISSYVDGIFITVTQPNERVKEVANAFGAVVSHFEWCSDFSAARNFNFSQVPKEYDYVLWCDADDTFRGIEYLRQLMEENPADAYSMNYLYAFDENKNPIVVHQKTMVVKNDGCVEWVGKLHEDFSPTREITRYFLKLVERLHLSTPERFDSAKQRNVEVAYGQLQSEPNDPRSYWNYANSLRAVNSLDEAINNFTTFLNLSLSDEEKYIAYLRRAECYWIKGDKLKALDDARYAIGMKPEYPDAYNTLGTLHYELQQYQKAVNYYLMALKARPPYYSIVVYNPRDYDYFPLMNLAKCYFSLNLPTMALACLKGCAQIMPTDTRTKDLVEKMEVESKKFEKIIKKVKKLNDIGDKVKMKEAIEKLPIDVKSHPIICNFRNTNFIKETSSGRDIVFFCGFTEKDWTPKIAEEKGVGGSEEAVIWLAKMFAKDGWNVEVYNSCGHKEQVFDGVTYKPYWAWNYRDKQDVVVLWRSARMAEYDINCENIILDLHDTVAPGELTEKRLIKINKIFVKSQFHRSLYPNVPDEKFVVVPNGIDSQLFAENTERDQFLMINTSSPDRSLSALVDMFAEVKKQVPQARCKWAYGWEIWDVVHSEDLKKQEWKSEMKRKMQELGIEELGRVSHGEVAKLYKTAGVFAYPSEFAEIDCISLSKAMAGGAIPVTTDFAAMGEKSKYGYFIHSPKTKDDWSKSYQYDFAMETGRDEWIEACVKALNGGEREEMRKWAQEIYDWNKVFAVWNGYICRS